MSGISTVAVTAYFQSQTSTARLNTENHIGIRFRFTSGHLRGVSSSMLCFPGDGLLSAVSNVG